MGDFRCHSLEICFSLVMDSPGSPGIMNEQTIPQNVMQHDDSRVVSVWCVNKNSANWCAQQS